MQPEPKGLFLPLKGILEETVYNDGFRYVNTRGKKAVCRRYESRIPLGMEACKGNSGRGQRSRRYCFACGFVKLSSCCRYPFPMGGGS